MACAASSASDQLLALVQAAAALLKAAVVGCKPCSWDNDAIAIYKHRAETTQWLALAIRITE